MQAEYTLKKLRELCINIFDEQNAFLLRSSLSEFPIPVIDEFFTGPKLNKPSGPDDREWTDIVRLAFIAFAPDGSEPARLRGKPIPRYARSYPFDPGRGDAAHHGTLVLYPTEHTSPLLKEIAISLEVSNLEVRSRAWLSRYLCDPFPLRSLKIWLGRKDSEWKPVAGLEADLQEMFAVLPDGLEELDIALNTSLLFSGGGINRLKSLRKLSFHTKDLPNGIDFSANTALESLHLKVASQGSAAIRGVGMLPALQDLHIECEVPFRYGKEGEHVDALTLESLGGLLARGIAGIQLKGIRYADEVMEGISPSSLSLEKVSGLKRVDLGACASPGSSITITSTSLESLCLGEGGSLQIGGCSSLKSIEAQLQPRNLWICDCPALTTIDIRLLPCSPSQIEFKNLPSLSRVKLDAAEVKMGLGHDDTPLFRVIGCSMSRLPEFAGGWRGLTALDLVGNTALGSLSGIEKLPDLQILKVRSVMEKGNYGSRKELPRKSHDALKELFSGGAPSMASVSSFQLEFAPLESLRGIESFPHLTSIIVQLGKLKSLAGMENLALLQRADLTGCESIKSLAPLAALTNLNYLKLSGCDRIKPKPPHTVMEGPELLAELVRHADPSHPIAKAAPSQDLAKWIELIGEGAGSDVVHALKLLSAFASEETAKLVAGVHIDPKTGWIRLPYLSRIKDEVVMGIPQLRILQAVGGTKAADIFGSVTDLLINASCNESSTTLRFGKRAQSGVEDAILEEFPSLRSLPDLPNLKKIEVNALSGFSLDGAEKFANLESLRIEDVARVDQIAALAQFHALRDLTISGTRSVDLTAFGVHPALKRLVLRFELDSLKGLENFPSLEWLQIRSTDDISALFKCAAHRRCSIAFKGRAGDNDMFWSAGFELRPIK